MKDSLSYKGFIAAVHFNADDDVFFGKIEEIDDLISFEGRSVSELKKAFITAVDDYLEFCEEHHKPVMKSYKGSFNVRIEPELHRMAVRKSLRLGISLNQLVQKAIEKEVFDDKKRASGG
jgi:predicted HicB family RNase H-like nuclease